MTALPLHPDRPTLPSAGSAWVGLDEAARLLGKSEGHLRRECLRLASAGQARRQKVGGRVVWQIAASYSPRLVRAAVETTQRGTSIVHELLRGSTEAQRDQANTRFAILKAFRAAKARDGAGGFDMARFSKRMRAEHGTCPGRRQLYQWHADCPPSSDAAGCVAALLDRRGRPKGTVESCSDAAWSAFAAMYLDMRQWSVAKCHRATAELAEQNGWAWPSYRYICQLVEQRIDPSTACLAREGLDAYNRRFKAPLSQDPGAWAPGQCWESDHATLDFQCRVIKGDAWVATRPQLTTWLDRRTRRVMGWAISEQGNQHTIRHALLSALRDPSVSAPEQVWIDNGKDFMARSIGGVTKKARRTMTGDEQRESERTATGLLNLLGIEPHFAAPYNHDGKARIERWHGFVHADFDTEFASYIGNRPGMVDRRNMPDDAKEVMNLPTLAEVRERFGHWAEAYNHRSEHRIDDLRDPETRERLSPAEFYERFLPTKRVVDADALSLLEPILSTPLKVTKKGIGFKIGGDTVYYGEMHPALERLVGTDQRVFVGHDPEDISSVRVWDESFRFVCIAGMNQLYGGDSVSRADLKSGLNARREQRKRVKQRIDLVALTAHPAELAARAARDRQIGETKARIREHDRTKDPRDVPNLRVVGTPLDGQAEAVARAEHRKAAGSEYDAVGGPNMPSLIDAVASFHQPTGRTPDAFASFSHPLHPPGGEVRPHGRGEGGHRPGAADPFAPIETAPDRAASACDADPFDFDPPPGPSSGPDLRITDAFP